MTAASEPPAPAPRNAAPARRGPGLWLAWTVAAFAAVALVLAGLAYAALQTERGARVLWQLAVQSLPGRLDGRLDGGTLAHGLRVSNLRYADERRQIRIDRLDTAWKLAITPLKLDVRHARAHRVEVTLLPTPPEPPQLPERLTLPLAIDLHQLAIAQVRLRKDVFSIELRDLLLDLKSDGRHHRIGLRRLATPVGDASLQLALDGIAPFALKGDVRFRGNATARGYTATANLGGNLGLLAIDLALAGDGLSGKALVQATPFHPIPLRQADIDIRGLDPRRFHAAAPEAQIDVQARLKPTLPAGQQDLSLLAVGGSIAVTNRLPGSVDRGLLPFRSARAQVRLDQRVQQFSRLEIALAGNGSLTGQGQVDPQGTGQADLRLAGVDLRALHAALQTTRLNGAMKTRFTPQNQHVTLALQDADFRVDADARLEPSAIHLDAARLQAGSARLQLRGQLGRDDKAAYIAQGELSDFNPRAFLALEGSPLPRLDKRTANRIPEASINGSFRIDGNLRPTATARARLDIRDSRYAGRPMTGGGLLQVAGKRLLASDFRLIVADNSVHAQGAFGSPGDRLRLQVEAPVLERLGFGLAGQLHVDGHFGGSLERPRVDAVYRARQLAFGPHRLATASGKATLSLLPDAPRNAPMQLELDAQGYRSAGISIDSLKARIQGTVARHSADASLKGKLRGEPVLLTLGGSGGFSESPAGLAWQGTLRQLENRGTPGFRLERPASLQVAPGRLVIGNTRARLDQTRIRLESLDVTANVIRSAGAFDALSVARVLALRQQFTGAATPLQTDLVLDGSWNFSLGPRADGFLQLRRQGGDIQFAGPAGTSRLGLDDLKLRADFAGQRMDLKAQAGSPRHGRVEAQGRLGLQARDGRMTWTADSPVSGRATASIPRLDSLGAFTGPRVLVNGAIELALAARGTLASPVVSGTLDGRKLALTLFDQGIRLRDGTAHIRLADNVAEIRELVFHGGQGSVRMTGSVPLDQDHPALRASIVAERLQLLSDPASNLVLSGRASVAQAGGRLAIDGKFIADRGRFSMPETPAPALDDDVIIVRKGDAPPAAPGHENERAGAERPAGRLAPAASIEFDLGRDFRFSGRGAEALLEGKLHIRSAPPAQPQASGTVTIARGTVEAFDTRLVIERGVINFLGALNNPNLNILAMRRNQEVAAGVHVTGNAVRPRVTLVSEPNVAEEQKLSWLIFGHAGNDESGQAQSAAQGAALALVNKFAGKRVASTIGIDEFSLQAGASGEQLVSLGKNISDRLTLGYKQSLSSAEAALELTYRLSQKWSVAARGGRILGVNVTYSTRFDRLKEGKEAKRQPGG